jgi:hypothetical protein
MQVGPNCELSISVSNQTVPSIPLKDLSALALPSEAIVSSQVSDTKQRNSIQVC